MKSHSFLCCGTLLCNTAAAFFIPYVRSPSLVQGDASALGPDGKPPSCLDGGNVTLYETSLPSKRSIDGSCGSHQSLVDQAYKDCAVRARAGEKVARAKDNASSTLLKAIFKDDSDKARTRISEHFAQIAVECEKNGGGPTPVACGFCNKGVAGLTVLRVGRKNGDNPVTLCDVAIRQEPNGCDRQVLGDVLLHELSHSWGLTDDNAYGIQDIQDLSSEKSLNNADSYTHFARAAKLGCKVQDHKLVEGGGSKDEKPGGGVNAGNPSGNGKDNGKDNGEDGGDGEGDGEQTNGHSGGSAGGSKGQPKPSTGRQGGSGNTPTSSAKGPGGAQPSSPSPPPHPTAKPSGGRQGDSGGMPPSSPSKGPGRGQPSSPSSPPSPSGKSPGGGQDESDGEGDGEGDGDYDNTEGEDGPGPCSYQNTNVPHSTVTTVIRPKQSTIILTVTRSPTSTVIVTVTKPREVHQTTTPTPSKSAVQIPDQTLPEESS
ncbi:hypothetical protein E4U59_005348 [Claviceps monticola]|nr:hypothetical protein E4U59_005348 [Claviceps monticola]